MPSARTLFVLALLAIALYLLLIYAPCPAEEELFVMAKRPLISKRGEVLIYSATNYFGSPIDDSFFWRCPEVKNYCRISNDIKDHVDASGVLFHNRDFETKRILRRSDQVYVWFTQESPVYEKIDVPENFINYTMTYLRDSDIWDPYALLEPTVGEEFVDFDKIWNSKTKTAAWLASNCHTKNRRMSVVSALLSKGLMVDAWGGCGRPLPNCPRHASNWTECVRENMRPYKFYLAFENSNCPDYVTEKFWKSLDDYWAVPIVMKRSQYDTYNIPPTAFIAVDDFTSLEDLAAYINRVSTIKTEYLKHHKWRTTHRVSYNTSTGICDLCSKLKHNDIHSKSYVNLEDWYSRRQCDDHLANGYLESTILNAVSCTLKIVIFGSSYNTC